MLLLIHGTFSKTSSPVEGFGPEFLGWAQKRYRAVLALDHWTLSKTPLDNAQMLAEQLRILAPELLTGRKLDVITHSRGGLVARSFCGLLDHADAVGQPDLPRHPQLRHRPRESRRTGACSPTRSST